MKTYEGTREGEDGWFVKVDGQPLSPRASQKIRNHSPDGFAWGYGGSGPAQLALAILLDYFGDAEKARALYQSFKFRVVTLWPMDENWKLTGEEIEMVCAAILESRTV